MHLSVVIPARNEEQTLPRQLDALLAQEWDKDWEVVVVDNGSTDGTAEVVTRLAQSDSRLRLISAVTPGACHARNAGIAATSAPLLAFCDADDVVEPGWIAAIAAALAEHELVTGCSRIAGPEPTVACAIARFGCNTRPDDLLRRAALSLRQQFRSSS